METASSRFPRRIKKIPPLQINLPNQERISSMDRKSAIFTRRSVRVYDPSKRATKEQILDILDAAMHAPTAMNKQPWEFVVATDPEVVSGITKIHPYCEFLPDAGSAIIVCGNLKEQFEIPEGGYSIRLFRRRAKHIAARQGTRFGHLLVRHSPRKNPHGRLQKILQASGPHRAYGANRSGVRRRNA